jgi:hypothetical protein
MRTVSMLAGPYEWRLTVNDDGTVTTQNEDSNGFWSAGPSFEDVQALLDYMDDRGLGRAARKALNLRR